MQNRKIAISLCIESAAKGSLLQSAADKYLRLFPTLQRKIHIPY